MSRTTKEMLDLARIYCAVNNYEYLSLPRRSSATREIYDACGSVRLAKRDTSFGGRRNTDEWIIENLNGVQVGEFVTHCRRDHDPVKWVKIADDLWSAK
jgi:hypothetical protein